MDKRIWESATENSYLIRPSYLNGYGNLFGGTLMQWMDEVAAIVARRHTRGEIRTVCVDNLVFTAPAGINDMVVIDGHITFVGSTSMEIKVDVYLENDAKDGKRSLINSAFFIMVSIGPDGRPTKVPGLIIETAKEREEFAQGKARYEARKKKA